MFPVLAAHITDEQWAAFSRTVMASAPSVGAHLNFGFFDLVGTPEELAVIDGAMPPELQPLVPAMREQAHATLSALRTEAVGA